MNEPINPERSEVERTLWHTLDEAGWSADQIRESFGAYRDEVLREAAEKIRSNAMSVRADEIARFGQTDYESDLQHAARMADADLVEPKRA